MARTSLDAQQTALALMAAGRSIDRDLWVWEMKTLERHLAVVRLPAELSSLSCFAVIPLMLAIIWLSGVDSYASRSGRGKWVLAWRWAQILATSSDSWRSTVCASVLFWRSAGMAAALAVMRLLSGLIFGGRVFDSTLCAVPIILCVCASLAAYLPARRLRHIDPMLALRAD